MLHYAMTRLGVAILVALTVSMVTFSLLHLTGDPAMALAGDDKLYVVHRDGRLKEISTETGYVLREMQVPEPAWDGLAIAERRLYLTTQTGEVICIGR